MLALAIVVTLMRSLELLPVSFFTESGVQIGSISEVILLSFALGDRITTLKSERKRILLGMNDILHGRTGDYFLSASCVHIDAKNLKARIASAGHPALLLYHPGRESPLETHPRGRLIGPFPDPSVEGLYLNLLTHYEDAVENFANRLYGEVRRWIGGGQFDDDFTLLVIDVRRDRRSWRLHRNRRRKLRQHRVNQIDRFNLRLLRRLFSAFRPRDS